MKSRVRRFYCRAMNLWEFGDYVFAASRSAARAAFFSRHHVYPFDISPA
ncbi:MAG: hypothetical protein ACOYM3_19240 [Terrimicrobiaceae bacterium]